MWHLHLLPCACTSSCLVRPRVTFHEYNCRIRKVNGAEALTSLYSEAFVFEDTSSGDYITDREKLMEYFDRLFALSEVTFSDIQFFACSDDRGCGEWAWFGKSFKSGLDYSVRGASLFVLGEGGIKRETMLQGLAADLLPEAGFCDRMRCGECNARHSHPRRAS